MPQDPTARARKDRWTWFTREMRKQLDGVLAEHRPQLEAAIAQGVGFTAGLKPIVMPDTAPAPEAPLANNDAEDDGA